MAGSQHSLVLDVRGCTSALRGPIVFSVVEKLIELDSTDSLVVVCDHEPAGLGYQLDLRKDTRGKFEYHYDRRLDGAWVALIRPKST